MNGQTIEKYQTRGALLSLVADFFSPFLLKPLMELNSAPRSGLFFAAGSCVFAAFEAEAATGGGGGGGATAAGVDNCFCCCAGGAVV